MNKLQLFQSENKISVLNKCGMNKIKGGAKGCPPPGEDDDDDDDE